MLAVGAFLTNLTLCVMDCAQGEIEERTEASGVRREQDLIQIDFMRIDSVRPFD